MDQKTYAQEAQRTNAGHMRGRENHAAWELGLVLREVAESGEFTDIIKKSLFYNKKPDEETLNNLIRQAGATADYDGSIDHINVDVLHGVLGIITEAAELAEVLVRAIETGEQPNNTKLMDEAADTRWYYELLAAGLGSDDDELTDRNIAKLRARFPDKFTTEDAVHRDREKENEAFEQAR